MLFYQLIQDTTRVMFMFLALTSTAPIVATPITKLCFATNFYSGSDIISFCLVSVWYRAYKLSESGSLETKAILFFRKNCETFTVCADLTCETSVAAVETFTFVFELLTLNQARVRFFFWLKTCLTNQFFCSSRNYPLTLELHFWLSVVVCPGLTSLFSVILNGCKTT